MNYIYIVFFVVVVGLAIYLKNKSTQKTSNVEEFPYKAKTYFFSRSEQVFLHILNKALDTERYVVYPKVRLADFIEVTTRGTGKRSAWNKIRAKHVDFLVWDTQTKKIALVIELDGRSHNSEKMQKSDEFKDGLYKSVSIRLERVKVGSHFGEEVSKIKHTLTS